MCYPYETKPELIQSDAARPPEPYRTTKYMEQAANACPTGFCTSEVVEILRAHGAKVTVEDR